MAKSFKILNLSFARDRVTGIKVLSALLSEITTVNLAGDINGMQNKKEIFNLPGTYFVFPLQSSTSEYLMDNPYERKHLDITGLVQSILEIDNKMLAAFFDAELVRSRDQLVGAI